MELLFDILLIVLPVFFVIGLGYSLKDTGLVDSSFLFQLNRLIYYVALPALLFYKISTSDFSASFNPVLLMGMSAAIIIVFAISYLYGVLRKYPPAMRGAFSQGAFRGNFAFIGLAIIFNAYGEGGFAIAGILLGFLVPVMNFFAVLALLLPQQENKQNLGSAFWAYQFVFNPLIIASFVGLIWSFFNIPMPLVLDKALKILTGMSLPLALIAIGASFSPKALQGEIVKALLASGIKLIWLPLLTAGILLFLGIRGQELAIGVIFAGTPTATGAYIMAQQLKSDAELTGSIIMLSTVLSIITFSVSLYILKVFGL
jgi:predicted permease